MHLMKWLLAFALTFGASASCLAETEHSSAAPNAEAEHGDEAVSAQAPDSHSAPNTGAGDPLYMNPDLAFCTLVVFLILLAVLWKVAWGPIVQALEKREAGISDNIAAAAAKHEEAKTLLAQHQARIDEAADEVRGMLEEARRDAEKTKTQIVAEARDAAQTERNRAIRDIEVAKEGAVKGLAEHSANLAIDLATQVVKQDITAERQNEIAREALSRMAASSPNNN